MKDLISIKIKVLPICFLVALSSCYKDSSSGDCAREERFDGINDCRNIKGDLSDPFKINGYGKFTPCFKGGDANQMVYIESTPETRTLVHYNRTNGEKKELFRASSLGKPYYGASGWISVIGNSKGSGCTFIHESGDSTFEWILTGAALQKGLYWNANGTLFFTRRYRSEQNDFRYFVVSFPSLEMEPVTFDFGPAGPKTV
ncbi:MAG: hypothetical protein KDC92_05315, partial [Bacteroidetes bacterium]|nr:hypothetical protein [Bacteroidota bacterium]